MTTSYETILVEKNDGITTIRLNRPQKKNAMSPTLHREMHAALRSLEFDDETQVLVITGSGDAFCAGQDLKEYFYDNKDSARQTEEIQRISHEWRHQILNTFPKPTIASINGYCFGGAFTIVASSDIAIAANEARFGLSEINFGTGRTGREGDFHRDELPPDALLQPHRRAVRRQALGRDRLHHHVGAARRA
jgi:trans-feruloyl-CoA hydratase/vanillin synthase